MAYGVHNINDIEKREGSVDIRLQRFLLLSFSERIARGIYGIGIDLIVFFAKIGLALILPFKFVQFFIQSWKMQNKKTSN